MAEVKTLRSQLDEIAAVLDAIQTPVQDIPAVTAFQQLQQPAFPAPGEPNSHSNGGGKSAVRSEAGSGLDWSALPAAVDPGSTAMGVSTRKKAAYKPEKQKPVDQEKVQARADRKRAQVESFLLVLRPVLEAAGHKPAAVVAAAAAAAAAAAQRNSGVQQPCNSCTHASASIGLQQAGWDHTPQQQPAQHQQDEPPATPAVHHASQQPGHQLAPPLSLHIVDFGCGSGNLLLPIAALLPQCRFTGVDMKPAALGLLMQRASAAGLSNVSVFTGMIEQYNEPFDVALALHACGNATDHVLQMAVDQRAVFVVSPCCVGKLRFSLTGGTSFHRSPISWTPTQPGDQPVHNSSSKASSQALQLAAHHSDCQQQPGQQQQQHAVPKLRHPRSDWLLTQLPQPEKHFRIMAKVADVSHAPSDRAELAGALQQRMHAADMCKRFVELDRCAAAAESGYAVGLFKVLSADSMAKNDLLVGLPLLPDTAVAGGVTGYPSSRTAEVKADVAAQSSGHAGQVVRENVLSCFCQCGEALHASGVLFGKGKLCGTHAPAT